MTTISRPIAIAILTSIGALIIGLTVGHSYGVADGRTSEAQVWQARTDSLLGQYADSYRAAIDSAKNEAEINVERANKSRSRSRVALSKADDFAGHALKLLDSLQVSAKDKADSLTLALQVVAQMSVTEHHLREVITEQEQAIASLEQAVLDTKLSLALAETRIEQLAAQLASVPKPKSCKILGLIPCPSPGTAAALGAVAGAAAMVAAGVLIP